MQPSSALLPCKQQLTTSSRHNTALRESHILLQVQQPATDSVHHSIPSVTWTTQSSYLHNMTATGMQSRQKNRAPHSQYVSSGIPQWRHLCSSISSAENFAFGAFKVGANHVTTSPGGIALFSFQSCPFNVGLNVLSVKQLHFHKCFKCGAVYISKNHCGESEGQ